MQSVGLQIKDHFDPGVVIATKKLKGKCQRRPSLLTISKELLLIKTIQSVLLHYF